MPSYHQIEPPQQTLPRSFAVSINEQPRRILLKEFLELVLGRVLTNAEFFVIRDRHRRRRKRPKPISIGRRPDTRDPMERRVDTLEHDSRDHNRRLVQAERDIDGLAVWVGEIEGGGSR